MQTPFEANGTITTLAQEADFLSAISATGRVSVFTLGQSQRDLPLRLVGVSTTAPAMPDAPTVTRSPLLVGSQHGRQEPSGREACLASIRDLAETTDQDTLSYIEANPVWFIPTWNPDAFMDGNPTDNYFWNGVNPNRDMLAVSCPETVSFVTAITAIKPCFILNAHENAHKTAADPAAELLSTQVLERLTSMWGVGDALVDAVFAAYDTEGITHGYYDASIDQRKLCWLSIYRSAPAIIMETSSGGVELSARVRAAYVCTSTVIDHMVGHADEFLAASEDDRAAIMRNAASSSIWLVAPQTPLHVTGYTLTAEQVAQVEHVLTAHGITWLATPEGGAWIPIMQDLALLVVQLFDAAAPYAVPGVRLHAAPDWLRRRSPCIP